MSANSMDHLTCSSEKKHDTDGYKEPHSLLAAP